VAYFLSMAGLSAYKDASRCEVCSCPWPPLRPSTNCEKLSDTCLV